jgi:hypothetical protein
LTENRRPASSRHALLVGRSVAADERALRCVSARAARLRDVLAIGRDEALVATVVRLLFFVRIVEQWRAISTCFGVLCLVRVGDCPSRMPDSEIEALKSMIVGGFVRLPEAPPPPARRKIAVGSRVRVTAGPFGGLSGLYQGQGSRDRERILLSMLGGQRPVLIAASLVVPLSEGASR